MKYQDIQTLTLSMLISSFLNQEVYFPIEIKIHERYVMYDYNKTTYITHTLV